MKFHEVRCFGLGPAYGNSALVIEGNRSTFEERQLIAHKSNYPACVFVEPCQDGDADFVADYYYPHARSPLCLHATLGIGALLLSRDGPLVIKTALRQQILPLSRVEDRYFVQLKRQRVSQPKHVPLDVFLPGFIPKSQPTVASVGSPKLLLEASDETILRSLVPNLANIVAWSKESGISGVYVWCRRDDGAFAGRNFNHEDPQLEDVATGVAAGALAAHLNRSVQLYQGTSLGNACVIHAKIEEDTIWVGGRALRIASSNLISRSVNF